MAFPPTYSRRAPSDWQGTPKFGWRRGTHRSTVIGLGPLAAPWGEADVGSHAECDAGRVASPTRTRQLTSQARTREEYFGAHEWTSPQAHHIQHQRRQDRLYGGGTWWRQHRHGRPGRRGH